MICSRTSAAVSRENSGAHAAGVPRSASRRTSSAGFKPGGPPDFARGPRALPKRERLPANSTAFSLAERFSRTGSHSSRQPRTASSSHARHAVGSVVGKFLNLPGEPAFGIGPGLRVVMQTQNQRADFFIARAAVNSNQLLNRLRRIHPRPRIAPAIPHRAFRRPAAAPRPRQARRAAGRGPARKNARARA